MLTALVIYLSCYEHRKKLLLTNCDLDFFRWNVFVLTALQFSQEARKGFFEQIIPAEVEEQFGP